MAGFADANFHRTDLEATKAWFLLHWLMLPAYAAYPSFRSLLGEDLRENVSRVDIPTLLMHGRHDQVCDVRWIEYLGERIEGARTVYLENSAHALMVEEPDRFSEEIAAFAGQPAVHSTIGRLARGNLQASSRRPISAGHPPCVGTAAGAPVGLHVARALLR